MILKCILNSFYYKNETFDKYFSLWVNPNGHQPENETLKIKLLSEEGHTRTMESWLVNVFAKKGQRRSKEYQKVENDWKLPIS